MFTLVEAMQGTELSCECFGAAALIATLSELPATLQNLAIQVASSGARDSHIDFRHANNPRPYCCIVCLLEQVK